MLNKLNVLIKLTLVLVVSFKNLRTLFFSVSKSNPFRKYSAWASTLSKLT